MPVTQSNMLNIKDDTYYGIKGAFLAGQAAILQVIALHGASNEDIAAVPYIIWLLVLLQCVAGYLFGHHAKNSTPDKLENIVQERDAYKNTLLNIKARGKV